MKHKTVRLFSGIISCLCGLVAASAQNLVQVNGEIPSLAERTASIPGLAPAKRPAPPAQMTIKRFSRSGPTAKALARLAENTKLAVARGEKEVPESYIVMLEDGVFLYAYREANGEEHLVDRAGLTLAETATKLVGELGGALVHVYTFAAAGSPRTSRRSRPKNFDGCPESSKWSQTASWTSLSRPVGVKTESINACLKSMATSATKRRAGRPPTFTS